MESIKELISHHKFANKFELFQSVHEWYKQHNGEQMEYFTSVIQSVLEITISEHQQLQKKLQLIDKYLAESPFSILWNAVGKQKDSDLKEELISIINRS